MSQGGTLTRAEISEAVHHRVGLSKAECQQLVDSILERMTVSLETKGQVKIVGFGTFEVRSKAARIGRNPKTGVEVPITPRKVLSFRASQKMRDAINAGG